MTSNLSNSSIEEMRNEIFDSPDNQKQTDKNLGVNGNQTDVDALYANFLYNGSDTNKNYHENAIKTADFVLKIAMGVFVVVTIYMGVIIFMLIKSENCTSLQVLSSVISSVFVDFLSATIIWTMKKWLESKNTYFEESVKGEELSKMIGLIRSMPEGQPKNQMIEKLVDNFCTNHKSNASKNGTRNSKKGHK